MSSIMMALILECSTYVSYRAPGGYCYVAISIFIIVASIIDHYIVAIISDRQNTTGLSGFPSGIIRENWNGTEKISMAPAQGRDAQLEKCKHYLCYLQKLNYLVKCWKHLRARTKLVLVKVVS